MKPSVSPYVLPSMLALSLLWAVPAQAHVGHATQSFWSGATHPLTGLGHLLAMLAVGFWGRQCGGRSVWALPVTFVGSMALAAILGHEIGLIPGVENAILLSLSALGVLLAASIRLHWINAMGLVALFGIVHGWAHGAEVPANASGLSYGLGFVLVTAGLHAVGAGAALWVQRSQQVFWSRWAGYSLIGASAVLAMV